jgi:2-polyprenyl-3-methyl-5-hydroxy-6-metoxy-1,4-benzoquinol methylase
MNFLEKLEATYSKDNLDANLRIPWETYLGEAKWGWYLISDEIEILERNSKVLEIGAGPQMLSSQVASKGMKLTSIEPASQGFSVMESLGRVVSNFSLLEQVSYEFLSTTGENFHRINEFDFAFSINVMEHVNEIDEVLTNVFDSLKPGGRYHFICPNYAFPYEPHFNSITLVNKRLTDALVKSRMIGKSKHQDPAGLWNSLNWISHRSVVNWASSQSDCELVFSRRALKQYITRAIEDKVFQFRHPLLSKLTRVLRPLVFLGLAITPMRFLPILDVAIVKSFH